MRIAKRVAELKDEGDIDETAFADFKKKFTDAVSNDLNTSMEMCIRDRSKEAYQHCPAS